MTAPDALDAIADALYDLLEARAQSIGILDIAVEVNDGYVDGELLFGNGPDLGLSLDSTGSVRYCELLEGDRERWLDETRSGLAVDASRAEETALAVLEGLLAARRPLLRRGD